MTNKTKQLIIAALMFSMNPIIATSELELINNEIKGMRSSLNKASNKEDRNRLHNTLIDKFTEYKEKATEIADKYENEGSPEKSLEYKAYARVAVAEIALIEEMLAKENPQTATDLEVLREDVSKKYEIAGKAFQLAARYASDNAKKTLLSELAGLAFGWAAGYASDEATKTWLHNKEGIALKSAADYASDEATKTQLYNNAGEAFQLAADYASDEETKTQLYRSAAKAFRSAADCASDNETKTKLLDKAGAVERAKSAVEKARQDAEEKARAEATAEQARQDALVKKGWRKHPIKCFFMLIVVALAVYYIFAFHPAILSTGLAYFKSLALLLLNSF